MTGPAWFSAVDSLPASMAAEVSAFVPRATLAGYQRFLDTMYHYTRGSEVRLRDAAAAATDDALRIFLASLAEEEAEHYRLAEADLRAFGRSPSAEKPESVRAFETAW